jgi:hypothetical protein
LKSGFDRRRLCFLSRADCRKVFSRLCVLERNVKNSLPSPAEYRKKYSELAPLPDDDYDWLEWIQPTVESSENPSVLRDRMRSASIYVAYYKEPLEYAFANLETLSAQWQKSGYVPKRGVPAFIEWLSPLWK